MLRSILKLGAVSLLAAAFIAAPDQLFGQSTNKPSAGKKPAAHKESSAKQKAAHPFRGKLAEVDQVAKTISVGQSVYYITSETKITKDGKPATLEDGVLGDKVTGYVKPAEDGKMTASSVKFGGKTEDPGGEKKKGKKSSKSS